MSLFSSSQSHLSLRLVSLFCISSLSPSVIFAATTFTNQATIVCSLENGHDLSWMHDLMRYRLMSAFSFHFHCWLCGPEMWCISQDRHCYAAVTDNQEVQNKSLFCSCKSASLGDALGQLSSVISSAFPIALSILWIFHINGSKHPSTMAAGREERIVQCFYPEVTHVTPAPILLATANCMTMSNSKEERGSWKKENRKHWWVALITSPREQVAD